MPDLDRIHQDTVALLVDAARLAGDYLAGIEDRPVFPDQAALDALDELDFDLPEGPQPPAETLDLLHRVGSPATVASTGGRYFGFVTGGTLPSALAASVLVAAWDQNAALPVMSPVAARLGEVTTRWLTGLLGLPTGAGVAFTTGATMANATALAAARDSQLASAGWDSARDGLFGAPPITVVAGEKVHSTIFKALSLVGLGSARVTLVPADSQGRLRPDLLPADVEGPLIVCCQAGEVNTGSFDPFPAVVEWARERNGWVHVDGAFGLWAAADPSRADLTEGMGDADSWATDGHKWLNVTYDCGIVATRRPEDLRRTFATGAGYLPSAGGFDAMHHSPQSSQRARQIEVWAALHSLGRRGVAEMIVRSCRQASRMAERLSAAGLEVVNEVVLNQVLVRAEDDEATNRLIAAVQAGGVCWCGPTEWEGRRAMRISVSCWATTDDDIEHSADAIVAARRP